MGTEDLAPTTLEHSYTCVFRGSRDHYHCAAALAEVDRLEGLVTDFYTPDLLLSLTRNGPSRLENYLRKRTNPLLPSRLVRNILTTALPLGYPWSRTESVGRRLSRRAARYRRDGALVYSYYWKDFLESKRGSTALGPQVVFQVHPMAAQVRRVLQKDREQSGIFSALEPEETMTEEQVEAQTSALRRSDGVLCASSFVRQGLIEAGVHEARIHVAPYGADRLPRYAHSRRELTTGPLQLLWLGQLSYRKGAHWLLDAMRQLAPGTAELTVVTRSHVPAWLPDVPDSVRVQQASDEELPALFAQHDAFVLPSLVEGFGLVYLESLSAGLPIIATRNGGAPDISSADHNAIFVEPGDPLSLREAIETLSGDRELLARLADGARESALPTWADFREDVRRGLQRIESEVVG